MKTQLTIFGLLLMSSSAFAGQMCIDRRATIMEPCPTGQQHHFVQGTCKKTYEFMNAICIDPKKTVLEIQGDVLEISAANGVLQVTVDEEAEVLKRDKRIKKSLAEDFAGNGFEAVAKPELKIKVCENAILTVEVGAGNILPNADGTEIYKMAEILTFNCAK